MKINIFEIHLNNKKTNCIYIISVLYLTFNHVKINMATVLLSIVLYYL